MGLASSHVDARVGSAAWGIILALDHDLFYRSLNGKAMSDAVFVQQVNTTVMTNEFRLPR
jgi:hypothetical protein